MGAPDVERMPVQKGVTSRIMENETPIMIELPPVEASAGFSAGLSPKPGVEFGEPDRSILAWIASHVRIANRPRMPN
jgi:hypothetical protein